MPKQNFNSTISLNGTESFESIDDLAAESINGGNWVPNPTDQKILEELAQCAINAVIQPGLTPSRTLGRSPRRPENPRPVVAQGRRTPRHCNGGSSLTPSRTLGG